MSKKKSHHVVKSLDGGWVVTKGGAARASKHFDNQKDAIEWGRNVAKNQKSEFYIHSEDGRVQSKYSYRNDSHLPKK